MFSRIKNIVRWVPVIWNDKDFDESFIFTILHFKLQNVERHMASDKCIITETSARKIVNEIKTARLLLERIIKYEYLNNATMWHDPNKERSNSFEKCSRHSEYMEQQDIEYLFKHISKHIQKWWA